MATTWPFGEPVSSGEADGEESCSLGGGVGCPLRGRAGAGRCWAPRRALPRPGQGSQPLCDEQGLKRRTSRAPSPHCRAGCAEGDLGVLEGGRGESDSRDDQPQQCDSGVLNLVRVV